mmetsp:Transcript_4885/g.9182  ORF Transcript_4885/g.9182 Transcript_4885/m.9182 type:complete len:341 (+) Transcript_4885:199-1221(+)|eukprot:CAMPEP_0114427004 /NCGR_PEP_ID=MMETSP0103-20121206/8106_1 /TAXON_ID=37642 ORGANISM="Paraphysomonas imperforata, Strain PA2" /NCGR_SAMPLE_ID=MMETSP0103 /ASSEMBLY_ACC=CAM_ASM_000201 /LENGTH=340 /DNA_ID=CAMNT_0001596015 /DNA_START=198 /DNA_END=1220 /DNA_ORIENTATION=+
MPPRTHWYCHCCTKKNQIDNKSCITCGRPDTYGNKAYLPLHDIGKKALRPNQVAALVPGEHLFDVSESTNWTALHSTASVGNHELVQELIRQGAVIEARSHHGQTPLHLAAFAGSLECCSLLVAAGADVNSQTFFEKNTPLHIAIQEGWGTVANYFIDVAGTDLNRPNAVGRTPLHIAATVGRSDIGAHLMRLKANPSVQDSLGWTPRQTAEFHKFSDFCELMIRSEMVDKQYSMKDVPPGKWDTQLWKDVLTSYHDKKKQLDKEATRFEKKIQRTNTNGSIILSRMNSFMSEGDDGLSTTTAGQESTVSDSFDAISRQKKAKEGISSLAMAAKRNVGFK